jgi:hypothetical protein
MITDFTLFPIRIDPELIQPTFITSIVEMYYRTEIILEIFINGKRI